MEQIIKIHIKKLPEGVYLATSKEVPGLVAQGRTVTEALEIARDVVKKLLEARVKKTPQQDKNLRDKRFFRLPNDCGCIRWDD